MLPLHKLMILLLALMFAGTIHAEEKEFLTVEKLLAAGFVQLDDAQLYELMHKSRIEVTDIETDRVAISNRADKAGMQRKFEESKTGKNKTMYFLDTRLLARAPKLEGHIERRIDGNAIVATDGIRSYRFRVYKMGAQLFAARDIDNGNVYYEVRVK